MPGNPSISSPAPDGRLEPATDARKRLRSLSTSTRSRKRARVDGQIGGGVDQAKYCGGRGGGFSPSQLLLGAHVPFLQTPPPSDPSTADEEEWLYKGLRRFARHGGPDLSSLRGYNNMPSEASSKKRKRHRAVTQQPSSKRTRSQTTRTSSQVSRASSNSTNFTRLLREANIPVTNEPILHPPDNERELLDVVFENTLDVPSDEELEKAYKTFNSLSQNIEENEASTNTLVDRLLEWAEEWWRDESPLEKAYIRQAKNMPFTQMALFSDDMPRFQPDLCDGVATDLLDENVRKDLENVVIAHKDKDLAVPNFFIEVKGPDGNVATVVRQATYDAACGARSMRSLQTYRQPTEVTDGNAYTMALTYESRRLRFFSAHVVPPNKPLVGPSYQLHEYLTARCQIIDRQSLFLAVQRLRNCRLWAARMRMDLIKAANDRPRPPPALPASAYHVGSQSSSPDPLQMPDQRPRP